MNWAELIDKHWAACYALALFTVFWVPIFLNRKHSVTLKREDGK